MGSQSPRPVTWSPTRAETLRRCPRRYYYAFVAAPRGRASTASEADRSAFVLSRLTSLELAIGTAVHARAREVARLVDRGALLPAAEDLLARCRGELNRLWSIGRDIPAFVAQPERRVAFAEALYDRRPGPSRIERLRDRLRNAIYALVEHPVWEQVRSLPRGAARVVDRPIRFDTPGTTYWGAPDLVISGSTKEVVVLDWKTGREEAEAVQLQLGSYAWLVRDGLRVPMIQRGCETRAIFLLTGTEAARLLSASELDDARERARKEAEAMSVLQHEEIGAFPLTTQRRLCPFCPFWGLCEAEIGQRRRASGTSCESS